MGRKKRNLEISLRILKEARELVVEEMDRRITENKEDKPMLGV